MVKNILYCEDDESTQYCVLRAIKNRFFSDKVFLAVNTTEALEIAGSHNLDLVVTDGFLLGKDTGWDLADLLRERGYTGPVIYAGGCINDIPEKKRKDFNDLLQKPFRGRDLAEIMRKYL